VESFKIGENLLFPASVDMIVANQIHNATDNNIRKLSGKLRPYIGKLFYGRVQWTMQIVTCCLF
jgi:hypothetical protein